MADRTLIDVKNKIKHFKLNPIGNIIKGEEDLEKDAFGHSSTVESEKLGPWGIISNNQSN